MNDPIARTPELRPWAEIGLGVRWRGVLGWFVAALRLLPKSTNRCAKSSILRLEIE